MDGGAAAFAGGAASEGMNDEDNERYNQRLTELKNMNISELEVAIASELKKPSKQKVLSLIEEQNTKALCWQFFSHVHERKKGLPFESRDLDQTKKRFVSCRACNAGYVYTSANETSTLNRHGKQCSVKKANVKRGSMLQYTK